MLSGFGVVQVGDHINVPYEIEPDNASYQNVLWESNDPDIATVTDGVVTGRSEGEAVITATTEDNGYTGVFLVYVSNDDLEMLPAKEYDFSMEEDSKLEKALDKQDGAGNTLDYNLFQYAEHGLSRISSDGGFQYISDKDFYGTEEIRGIVSNGRGGIIPQEIHITVNGINDSPITGNGFVSVTQGSFVGDKVKLEDPDGDDVKCEISNHPSKGTVVIDSKGNFTYTADKEEIGKDHFTIFLDDDKGGSSDYEVEVYIGPKGPDIINTLKSVSQDKHHPRTYGGAYNFSKMKESIQSGDETAVIWFESVKAEADDILTKEPREYEIPDGKRLLSVSKEVLKRVRCLGLTYIVTKEESYAKRLWEELESAGNFKDWNPKHFLDTGEMTNAFGTAYDWLYNYWSPEQKSFIVKYIKEKGLLPGIDAYHKNEGWTHNENNWNAVCNGGLTVGALAVADEGKIDSEIENIAATVLEHAIRGLPYMLKEYAPDGAWGEGPGYWEYGTNYTVFMLSSMIQSLGTDYGLSEFSGMDVTTEFPIYNNGSVGAYNFGDGNSTIIKSPVMLWMGKRYQNTTYYWAYREANLDAKVDPLALLWYPGNEEYNGGSAPDEMDKKFGGVEVGTMRSSWYDRNGTFLGLKGGYNQFNHCDLDQGSFVYDAYGVRWAKELGSGNYNAPGYFSRGNNGQRWTYYKKEQRARIPL